MITASGPILGIHQSGSTSAAALVRDGRVVAAQPEERFTRRKYDRDFPNAAIDYCLSHAPGGWPDVRHVAIGWNAGENAAIRYRGGFSDWMRYPGEWLTSVPNHVLTQTGMVPQATTTRFETSDRSLEIHFVDHHTAHARLAAASSGSDDCAVLVVDGWSEQKVTSLYRYRGGALELLKSELFPNSIGCFYAAMTEHLGYRPFSDEWRVMGMAAYGRDDALPELDTVISLRPDGRYQLDLHCFDFYNFDRGGFTARAFEERFGPARRAGEPLEQRHFDFAAAAQRVFERVMLHVLTDAYRVTECQTVCLAGGAALNCLFNARVTALTPFTACHVSFAPDDSGNALGAGLEVFHRLTGTVPAGPGTSALGPEFDDDEIGDLLERYRLSASRLGEIGPEVARMLADGQIVGWFQGRSEFGPRALGQRSILANPATPGIKDKLNRSIKFREAYRPFAPVVPLSAAGRYFDGVPQVGVPFMEKAPRFKADIVDRVPGCVHADGTGRVQTVDESGGHVLLPVLAELERLTGDPVVINTSFNLNGEPIVLTPTDAIRTFYSSGLDALALGGFLLKKEGAA